MWGFLCIYHTTILGVLQRSERERELELDRVSKTVVGDTIYYMEAENLTALNFARLCTPVFLVK
jgi:hypothetical protein